MRTCVFRFTQTYDRQTIWALGQHMRIMMIDGMFNGFARNSAKRSLVLMLSITSGFAHRKECANNDLNCF